MPAAGAAPAAAAGAPAAAAADKKGMYNYSWHPLTFLKDVVVTSVYC